MVSNTSTILCTASTQSQLKRVNCSANNITTVATWSSSFSSWELSRSLYLEAFSPLWPAISALLMIKVWWSGSTLRKRRPTIMGSRRGRTQKSSSTGLRTDNRTASASLAISAPILPRNYAVAIAASDCFVVRVASGRTTTGAWEACSDSRKHARNCGGSRTSKGSSMSSVASTSSSKFSSLNASNSQFHSSVST